jgi:hypothetical protein
MAGSKTRSIRIVAAVACPECGALAGEPCKNREPHRANLGPEDRRGVPIRPHNLRRMAWIEWKQQNGII